ncbi:hypothetical protein P691DRAFT_793579 [Macrolepiota fuliginosa MF-IS2]|uniref:Uncharacterized protein n=1 Tax=Macrolepiota fuliginosa MF-IS2 TaxID=1400762 RepID=A0A9P5XCK0_9AGAR|nr:hypothetical protein P691DRAFT_793579 [Macrolepiota fuliginosa MF-IS2]
MAPSPTIQLANRTSGSFDWLAISRVEQAALSAQGELQKVLSAYFERPISITVVSCETFWYPTANSPREPLPLPPDPIAIAQASPETPIIQKRRVHLVCSGKVVCTATSTIHIISPSAAYLFLVENYAICQVFRRMEREPKFQLLDVGIGPCHFERTAKAAATDDTSISKDLWRRYCLDMPSFSCEIVEVFPDRRMFRCGVAWLDEADVEPVQHVENAEQYPEGMAVIEM